MSFCAFFPVACNSATPSPCTWGKNASVTLPISSNDSSPQLTATGGDFGLCGFSAELSQLTSPSRRVPFGSVRKSLKKYPSCQAKSQLLIHSSSLVSPEGSVAASFIVFPL